LQVPQVDGLEAYIQNFPDRIIHSKSYRSPESYANKNVLVIGNSSSGHDVIESVQQCARLPVYVSRHSQSRWEGPNPPPGIVWKPVISRFLPNGEVVFADGTILRNIDAVIYCTGYKASFPFWNSKVNGGPLYEYERGRLIGSYQHTFFRDHPTLGIVGLPRVLTFRSFEYQAVALARIFAGRNALPLPDKPTMEEWERDRDELVTHEQRKFHDVPWENPETGSWVGGETWVWFKALYDLAGLPQLGGAGRCPPVLDEKTRWAIENLKKFPDPKPEMELVEGREPGWEVVRPVPRKDLLHFI
jgi:hypothetical protein